MSLIQTGWVIRTESGDYSYYGPDKWSCKLQHHDLYYDETTKEWDMVVGSSGVAQSTAFLSFHPILESR